MALEIKFSADCNKSNYIYMSSPLEKLHLFFPTLNLRKYKKREKFEKLRFRRPSAIYECEQKIEQQIFQFVTL